MTPVNDASFARYFLIKVSNSHMQFARSPDEALRVIRDSSSQATAVPDCAALHPGDNYDDYTTNSLCL